MTRQSFSEIPLEALRAHGDSARIERVWRRLELDVARRPSRSGFRWAAPAAAALGIFGIGILVGVRLTTPAAEVAAVAEPQAARAAPGGGLAAEPEAETTHPEAQAAPKRRRARSALPAGDLPLLDEPPGSYGEALGEAAQAPPVATGPAEWERLAEAGDFPAAKAALDREGGVAVMLDRASASQLMLLADIARAAGSREQALLALERVLSAHVSAPEAPLAAWTLGNLLEQGGDRTAAAAAYATYRRLSPAGDFAEDAAARQVDVAISQGNTELAGRAVDEYAQNFPNGRRLAELRKRVAALGVHSATGDSGAAPSAEPDDDDDAAEEPASSAPDAPGATAPAPARQH